MGNDQRNADDADRACKGREQVRVFLVQRLLKLRVSEVHHDMEEWPMFL